MQEVLKEVDKIEYIAIVSRDFNILKEVKLGHTIILVACIVGRTHLIDNVWV